MENDHIIKLLELSIEVELGVAAMYQLFSELHPDDGEFWAQLRLEEKSHATLLRAALDSFTNRGLLPYKILATSVEGLHETNKRIEVLVDRCKASPPSRHDAFALALVLENESGEHHYNHFMEKEPENTIEEVFQQLNREDKDHEKRIRAYFDSMDSESAATGMC